MPIADRESFTTRLREYLEKSVLRSLKSYSELQARTSVLFVSGDNAWSHRRQAGESSVDFITPTTFEDFKLKPNLAYILSMKEIKEKVSKIALETMFPRLARIS